MQEVEIPAAARRHRAKDFNFMICMFLIDSFEIINTGGFLSMGGNETPPVIY